MEIKYKYIKRLISLDLEDEFIITGLCEDIQFVEAGCLFYVRQGKHYNSYEDVDTAILKKAIVIHGDAQFSKGHYVENIETALLNVCDYMYSKRQYGFILIGVCGTNGKSSVVASLQQMLDESQCMRIGTHAVQLFDSTYEIANTTPNIITLMQIMELAQAQKVKYVIMEVSSHAIDQERIRYLRFDYVIYTNIAQDHLDYHKTLLHYRYTKYKLTQYLKEKGIVIANKDELYYQELRQVYKGLVITYGCSASHFHVSDIEEGLSQTSFYVNRFYFRTQLIGKVNAYNISAAITLLRLLSISYYEIYQKVLEVRADEGRLQCIYHQEISMYIDYAHTAKALQEVLTFFSIRKAKRLIVVVGCGGNREKEKRADVGYYASYYSDVCIFTEDNSREESTRSIIEDMLVRAHEQVVCIENRYEALEYAVNIAQKNDIILVSGKGNEQTLDKDGERIPFSDQAILRKLVGEKVWN